MKKYSPDETLFIPVMLCSYVIFIVYLTFCFYCNFELLIKFSITNIIRLIALFHLWTIKHTESKLNEQSCLGQPGKNCSHGEISFHLRDISSTLSWGLTWVRWIDSHINDLFLQSKIYDSAEISLSWDVSLGLYDFSHKSSSSDINQFLSSSIFSCFRESYSNSIQWISRWLLTTAVSRLGISTYLL